MNITVRNKLIIVLLLSIIVLGGGGFYLYFQYTHFDKKYSQSTVLLFDDVNSTQPEIIISPVQTVGGMKKSSRSRTQCENEPDIAVAMSNSSSPSMGNTAFPTQSFGFQQSSGLSGYRRDIENKEIYSGGGGGSMLLASSTGKRGTSGWVSSSFGGSGGMINQPAFVPFQEGNNTKQALVDPGIETQMMKITPVGDSLWLFLLLAAAYVGIKRFKR